MPCSVAVSKADVASSQIRSLGALQEATARLTYLQCIPFCKQARQRIQTLQVFTNLR